MSEPDWPAELAASRAEGEAVLARQTAKAHTLKRMSPQAATGNHLVECTCGWSIITETEAGVNQFFAHKVSEVEKATAEAASHE